MNAKEKLGAKPADPVEAALSPCVLRCDLAPDRCWRARKALAPCVLLSPLTRLNEHS